MSVPPVIEAPSPNHGDRKGAAPSLVVLHYTAMATVEAAVARLRDPLAEVSAHWVVAEDGRLWRLVPEARRAWHAGAGGWGGCADVNSASIGIELANPGDRPFPLPQMCALEALLSDVLARWSIPPSGVIGHACMAPERKQDPGRRFDWRALGRRGLCLWENGAPGDRPADAAAFRAAARAFGYPLAAEGVWDAAALATADAFQARFRPWERGPLTTAALAQLERLAARC